MNTDGNGKVITNLNHRTTYQFQDDPVVAVSTEERLQSDDDDHVKKTSTLTAPPQVPNDLPKFGMKALSQTGLGTARRPIHG